MPFLAPPFVPPLRRRQRSALRGSTIPAAPAAPDTPSSPSPTNAATAYYTLLSWVSARGAKFDIYLDTVNPPVTIVVPKHVGTTYVPTLNPATTYYWKIVAFNDGGSATGPVWSFVTPAATAVIFTVAGAIATSRARFDGCSIHSVLSAAPNLASLTFDTTEPTAGQAVAIGLGTLDDDDLIFGGEVQSYDHTYVGTPEASALYPATLIDHTFRANKRRPFGTWTNVSASTIGRYLVSVFADGFTANGIQNDLPEVSINFDGLADFMTCFRALATAISSDSAVGNAKITYARDVQLFMADPDGVTPDPIDASHPPLNHPSPIRFSVDHSQLRTRVYGKGHGVNVPCDVGVSEVIVPIADASQFTDTGGRAIASTTAEGAQTDILTYVGVQLGGAGSIIGPGAAPTVAPFGSVNTIPGTGVTAGVHQYAYLDVTGSGRSLPSPLMTITVGAYPAIGNPADAPSGYFGTTNGASHATNMPNGLCWWGYSHKRDADGAETAIALLDPAQHNPGSVGANAYSSTDTAVLTPPPVGYSFQFYRTKAGGTTYYRIPIGEGIFGAGPGGILSGTVNLGTFREATADADLVDPAPNSNGATNGTATGQVALTGIAVGPSAVTAREVYRTAAGGSQLKLLTTIADNTTTIFTDNLADASLGANAPVSDTSGLTQPTGQVNAGSVSILLAAPGVFLPGGGWATCGSQTIRYTGLSTNTLTGVPATGVGSIQTTILYGAQIFPAPALTGVNHNNGVTRALARGSSVHIWVQVDDLDAQAALGALELDENGDETDGIREYVITDDRRSEESLTALCTADLAMFSRPIVSAGYYTRDIKTRTGRSVSIDLVTGKFNPLVFTSTFNVATTFGQMGEFTIQDVTITFDGPALNPLYKVKASSTNFALSDLLRRAVLV